MRLPTIKVIDRNFDRGFRTINKTDFDPDIHAPFESKAASEPKPKEVTPVAPEDVDMSDVEAMTWQELRSRAADVSDSPISTKEDAIEAIRAHRAAQGSTD